MFPYIFSWNSSPKAFLNRQVKKKLRKQGLVVLSRFCCLVSSNTNQTDRNVAKICSLPSQWSTHDPRNSYLNFDKKLPCPPPSTTLRTSFVLLLWRRRRKDQRIIKFSPCPKYFKWISCVEIWFELLLWFCWTQFLQNHLLGWIKVNSSINPLFW